MGLPAEAPVCLDVDMTVFDSFPHLLAAFNERFGTNIIADQVTTFYYLNDVTVGTPEERQAFFDQATQDGELLLVKPKSLPGSVEGVNKLSQIKPVHFITARQSVLYRGTVEQMIRHGFPASDRNVHTRGDPRQSGTQFKVDRNKELRACVFAEDNGETALAVTEEVGIPVVLFDYP